MKNSIAIQGIKGSFHHIVTKQYFKNKIDYLDCTITGMGRGAGNVKTELLAIEISDLRNTKLNIRALIK